MDEGSALIPIFIIVLPIVIIVLPIVISSFILYFILRNKKLSIVGSIVGFVSTITIEYIFGLWYLSQVGSIVGFAGTIAVGYILLFLFISQIVRGSQLVPFLILICASSLLIAFMGLIFIKISRKVK